MYRALDLCGPAFYWSWFIQIKGNKIQQKICVKMLHWCCVFLQMFEYLNPTAHTTVWDENASIFYMVLNKTIKEM